MEYCKSNKNATEIAKRRFVVFMIKMSLLTPQPKSGFQSFFKTIPHWEMNPKQDAYQTSIKMR